MKKLILVTIVFFFISCNKGKKTIIKPVEVNTTQNFNWLLGKWQRVNEKEGKQTFENWDKKSKKEYIGLGYTVQGRDTISSETMQIVRSNEAWYLNVSVIGKGDDLSTVTFKMIKNNANSFTFENKENDFPNIIYYEKENDTLNALISGGEMEIPFEFVRL